MNELIVPITPAPITEWDRELEMFELTFDKKWNVSITSDIFLKDRNGIRLFDKINNNPTLTEAQKRDAKADLFPKKTPAYTTKDSYVNIQGQPVPFGTEGAIPETDFLFSLTFGQFKALLNKTDDDSVLGAIKEFVGLKMQEIAQRGQL